MRPKFWIHESLCYICIILARACLHPHFLALQLPYALLVICPHLQFYEHTGPYKKKTNDNSTVPEVGQVEFTFLAVRFLLGSAMG